MTEQEAIKILQINCTCSPKATEFIKASNIAIKALEKQIPKKPKGDYNSCPHHRCPTCNGAARMCCDDGYNPYCQFRGQKLDWGNKE